MLRVRPRLAIAAGAAVAALVGPAVPAPADQPQPSVVHMANYSFRPAAVTATAGDAITWVNDDEATHDVRTTDGPEPVQSPELSQGQSWTFVVDQPGAYSYICSVHPSMRGTITVAAAPAAAAPIPAAASPPVASASVATTVVPTKPTPSATAGVRAPTFAVASPSMSAARSQPDGLARLRSLFLLGMVVSAVAGGCLLLLGGSKRSTAPE